MAKTKTDKKPIVLTKENLLYQPLTLATSGYNATAFQQNIIIGVLRKLKTTLSKMKDGQFQAPPVQLSLFDSDEAKVYRHTKDEMKFAIHMKELGVEPNNYQRAFNEVAKLGSIQAWMPEVQPDGSTHLRLKSVFGIEVDGKDVVTDDRGQVVEFKYSNRNPTVYINLEKDVADFLFDPTKRIYDFIDDTAMMIKDKYPKRLYMFLSNVKYLEGGLTIGYWKFRREIGFDDSNMEKIMYPQFYDFRKKVLDCSADVLKTLSDKELCDFWFEWEPIYKGSRKAKAPDELHFTIHLSNVGQSIKDDKNFSPNSKELERRLREEFEQTSAQIQKILYSMNPEDYAGVNAKLDELSRYFESTKTNIKNKRAYTNKVITDLLSESRVEEVVTDEKPIINEIADDTPVINDRALKMWGDALMSVREDMREGVKLVEWGSDKVIVSMQPAFIEMYQSIVGDNIVEVLKKSTGKNIVVKHW